MCPKSTVMFAYFAQWFTDGFLRSDRHIASATRAATAPTTRSTCSQLYGCDPACDRALRTHDGGRLKSQIIGGAEFPPYLCEDGEIKARVPRRCSVDPARPDPARAQRDTLFADGQRHDELAARLRACSTCCSCASTTGSPACSPREYPALGRRAAVPDGAQHHDRAPDQDRDRGVHQPHHALPLPASAPIRGAVRATSAGTGRTGWRSSSTCSTAGTA